MMNARPSVSRAVAMPNTSAATLHLNEFLNRDYRHVEQIRLSHNTRWRTYWRLRQHDGTRCFAKVNYGSKDNAHDQVLGRKEALLSEYFRALLVQIPGWTVPCILNHWKSDCGCFVVSEWMEMKPVPLISILERREWTDRLANLLCALDELPPPPDWSENMVTHDFGCVSKFVADENLSAPFGFDLDDNISFMTSTGELILHDFELIQWASRGLQGTYVTLKSLYEFRKHMVGALRGHSPVRRLARTVPRHLRRARLGQAAEVLRQARQRKHKWPKYARLRLMMARGLTWWLP